MYLNLINLFFFCYSWNADVLLKKPFPHNFEYYERTLRDLRKTKFARSPKTAIEIENEFQKESVMNELGFSLCQEKGLLYNGIDIGEEYCNCFFSSAKSISLVKENIDRNERFFLMDGTFRVTPNGIFQQLLVLYIQYGIKVIFFFQIFRTSIE